MTAIADIRLPEMTGLLTQEFFPINHRHSAISLIRAQTVIMQEACAIAHRLVYCDRSRQALNFAFSQPATDRQDFVGHPPRTAFPSDWVPDAAVESYLLEMRAKDPFTIVADTKLDHERPITDGLVDPQYPKCMRIMYKNIEDCADAREYNDAIFIQHLLHLAIVIAHETVHCLRRHLPSASQPSPPRIRGFFETGREDRLMFDVEEGFVDIVKGVTGETGWWWETEMFGGVIGRVDAEWHRGAPYKGKIERLVHHTTVETNDGLTEAYCTLPLSVVLTLIQGKAGWEHSIPIPYDSGCYIPGRHPRLHRGRVGEIEGATPEVDSSQVQPRTCGTR